MVTYLEIKYKVINTIFSRYWQRKIKNKNFTIIANNCIGLCIYNKLGLQYATPTVGVWFFSDDYIRFLENFEYYIKQPLKFKQTSKHPEIKEHTYPIGILDDVEIQFPHEKNEVEAAAKWERRTKRINLSNLFVIYSDRDKFQEEYFKRFQNLSFEHKIFLSSKPRSESNVVFVQDYKNDPSVGVSPDREYEKYFDVIKWLNGEKDFLKSN